MNVNGLILLKKLFQNSPLKISLLYMYLFHPKLSSPYSLHSCYFLHFTSLHFISFHFISLHFTYFNFIPLLSTSFPSFHFIPLHFTSFYFIPLPFKRALPLVPHIFSQDAYRQVPSLPYHAEFA